MEVYVERNGFVIRANGTESYPFQVYHRNFDGVYIDAFKSLSDAEAFCIEEDADDWEDEIRKI